MRLSVTMEWLSSSKFLVQLSMDSHYLSRKNTRLLFIIEYSEKSIALGVPPSGTTSTS